MLLVFRFLISQLFRRLEREHTHSTSRDVTSTIAIWHHDRVSRHSGFEASTYGYTSIDKIVNVTENAFTDTLFSEQNIVTTWATKGLPILSAIYVLHTYLCCYASSII